MTSRPRLSKALFWIATPLGLGSAGFAIYFGIDVVQIWLRPKPAPRTPLPDDAGPVEVIVRGASASADLLGGMGEGIVQGLFYLALTVLAIALGMLYLSRKLR